MRVCTTSLLLEPFRAALTGRMSSITLLSSSVFQDKAEVPTSVFHAAGTPHPILPMSHPQTFTALTNCTTGSNPAPFMSSASKRRLKSPAPHRARPPFHCQYLLFCMQSTLAVQRCQYENLAAKQIFSLEMQHTPLQKPKVSLANGDKRGVYWGSTHSQSQGGSSQPGQAANPSCCCCLGIRLLQKA